MLTTLTMCKYVIKAFERFFSRVTRSRREIGKSLFIFKYKIMQTSLFTQSAKRKELIFTSYNIIYKIKNHHLFDNLNWIQKERILCPVHEKWYNQVLICFKIDRIKTINLIKHHISYPNDFKPIILDILSSY